MLFFETYKNRVKLAYSMRDAVVPFMFMGSLSLECVLKIKALFVKLF